MLAPIVGHDHSPPGPRRPRIRTPRARPRRARPRSRRHRVGPVAAPHRHLRRRSRRAPAAHVAAATLRVGASRSEVAGAAAHRAVTWMHNPGAHRAGAMARAWCRRGPARAPAPRCATHARPCPGCPPALARGSAGRLARVLAPGRCTSDVPRTHRNSRDLSNRTAPGKRAVLLGVLPLRTYECQ